MCIRDRAYIEQIRTFIRKNTRGGQQQSAQQQSRPAPSQSRPAPSSTRMEEEVRVQTMFPYRIPVYYESINLDGLSKKIIEHNDALKAKGDKIALTDREVGHFERLRDRMRDPPTFHAGKVPEAEIEILKNKLLAWPVELSLPTIDLFRIFALHYQSEGLFSGLDSGLPIITTLCAAISKSGSDAAKMVSLRALANLLRHTMGAKALQRYLGYIIDALLATGVPETGAKNLREALATFLLNLSMQSSLEENDRLSQIILRALRTESDAENLYKLFVAIGNLASTSGAYRSRFKSQNANGDVRGVTIPESPNSASIENCRRDLLSLL
eukprot:TRINITY_DN7339_c0_g1_i2.p2 TRINITY_DN7339_c0_g1~~TRINITY_DN7339_c0_g1_i2.p2  ORF type:complete len:326 (-),score=84.56 TRINITY_DN7339_c0_g1_i2:1523-2500(-)